jgi:hypothetical protein
MTTAKNKVEKSGPALWVPFAWMCVFLLGASALLQAQAPASVPEPDGPTLATMLCSMEPLENSEVRGRLQVKQKKNAYEAPMTCKVIRKTGSWESVFEAGASQKTGPEKLVIIHIPGKENQYLYARAEKPSAPLPELQSISADRAATTGFAGSDYSLADLGLDFLRWPKQQRLPDATRLDRPCYVLESVNERASEIVRVRSFIDKEYSGMLGSQGFPALLVVEGFDIHNKDVVKEFSLHGSSFKKVNGRYQLEKMEISNEKTDSQTVMRFD